MKAEALAFSAIAGLGAALRRHDATPRQAVEACLAQIAAHDGGLNAFSTVMADRARAAADRAGAELAAGIDRGPLHGVPVAIKDLIDVAGVPTGYGADVVFQTVPSRNATLVDRLETAGAVIIGKTNMLEFAYGAVNLKVGQTNNPWDIARTAGGSSGGSAAAVATGMAYAAVGTDTGGSIRIPAAYCGVVGLKPTYALVPVAGVFPLSQTLDHVGPMARTCADTLVLLDVLAGTEGLQGSIPLAGRRLGILRDLIDGPSVRPDVRAAFDAACETLVQAGAVLTDVHLPELAGMQQALLDILLPEAALIHATRRDAHAAAYASQTLAQIDAGPTVSATAYVRAMEYRQALSGAVDRVLGGLDALISLTAPWVAPAEDPAVDGDEGLAEMMFTGPTNLTGHPSLSLFGGLAAHGLPIGLLLTGARGADRALLRLGLGIEAVLPPVIAPAYLR